MTKSTLIPNTYPLSLILYTSFLLQGASLPQIPYFANQDGLHSIESERLEEGIKHFQEGLDHSPNDYRLRYNLGNAQHMNKEYEAALKTYQKALDSAPPQEEAAMLNYNMGNTYFRQGQIGGKPQEDWQKAIESYQKALALNPEDKDAQENLQFVKQQLDKAKQQMQNQPGPGGQNNQGQNQPDPSQNQGQNGQQNQNQSGNPQNGGQKHFDEREIERFLNALENDERKHRNPNYFKRFQNQQKQNKDLFDLTPEELMSMSPKELADLLKKRGQGSNMKNW